MNAPSADRERFAREVAAKNLKPLWERTAKLEPGGSAAPAIWRYDDVRRYLLVAGELITAHEAERRVLMLENPSLAGTTFIGTTLFAGMQLILPGEVAPAHRHSPNALRFIVEGEGGYTTVNGRRIAMRPGDFVVTPGWSWHDHGNLGSSPVIWMDGLDSPLAQFFGAHFREGHACEAQPVSQVEASAGTAHYPYQRMRDAVMELARREPPHPSHGYRRRYLDPGDGCDPIPTLAVFLRWLPAGFSGAVYRSTECTVFNVAEGRGAADIGNTCYEFAQHDVFVVPPWTPYRLSSHSDCVLFSYSDRAAQEALGFWREQS